MDNNPASNLFDVNHILSSFSDESSFPLSVQHQVTSSSNIANMMPDELDDLLSTLGEEMLLSDPSFYDTNKVLFSDAQVFDPSPTMTDPDMVLEEASPNPPLIQDQGLQQVQQIKGEAGTESSFVGQLQQQYQVSQQIPQQTGQQNKVQMVRPTIISNVPASNVTQTIPVDLNDLLRILKQQEEEKQQLLMQSRIQEALLNQIKLTTSVTPTRESVAVGVPVSQSGQIVTVPLPPISSFTTPIILQPNKGQIQTSVAVSQRPIQPQIQQQSVQSTTNDKIPIQRLPQHHQQQPVVVKRETQSPVVTGSLSTESFFNLKNGSGNFFSPFSSRIKQLKQ